MLTSLFLGIEVRIGVTTFYWVVAAPFCVFLTTLHVTFLEVV